MQLSPLSFPPAGSVAPAPDRNSDPLRVLVADDDPMSSRVIRDALQADGIVVVAEARDGREALELARHYRPEIVLMDVVMPGIDGIEATRGIVAACPTTRVLVLTSTDDDELGLLALRAGAFGFLGKTTHIDRLPTALRSAVAGDAVVSPRLAMQLVEHLRQSRQDTIGMRPVKSPLTDREWEILDLLCQLRSTEEVADELVLSTETVRSHVKNVLHKLHVSSRRDAVALANAIREDLVSVRAR